jgi:hypothetical protein
MYGLWSNWMPMTCDTTRMAAGSIALRIELSPERGQKKDAVKCRRLFFISQLAAIKHRCFASS